MWNRLRWLRELVIGRGGSETGNLCGAGPIMRPPAVPSVTVVAGAVAALAVVSAGLVCGADLAEAVVW